MATVDLMTPSSGESLFTGNDGETDDEIWDATTSWDMRVEVPAQLIEYVDDNVKARESLA